MKTVKLYGHLAKEFGSEFKLKAKSPAEALNLLRVNFIGFQESMASFLGQGYLVIVGKEQIALEDLHKPVSSYDTIKIIPIVRGAGGGKGSGLLMIVAGAALMYFSAGLAAAALPGAVPGAMTGMAATLGSSAGMVASIGSSIGMSLVLSGISSLLYSPPPVPTNAQSINFDGAINTVRQGECVPVGYGRCMVGSAVISAGISTQLFNGI